MLRRYTSALSACRRLRQPRISRFRSVSVEVQRVKFRKAPRRISRRAVIASGSLLIYALYNHVSEQAKEDEVDKIIIALTTVDGKTPNSKDSNGKSPYEKANKQVMQTLKEYETVIKGLEEKLEEGTRATREYHSAIDPMARKEALRKMRDFDQSQDLVEMQAKANKLKDKVELYIRVVEKLKAEGQSGAQQRQTRKGGKIDTPSSRFFVPLWWPRQLDAVRYQSSDPEWQEFIKFHLNSDLNWAIRSNLNDIALNSLTTDPGMKNLRDFLGEPILMYTSWLDVDYPRFPPPEYVQFGLEFSSQHAGGVQFIERTVDATNVKRLEKVAYPSFSMLSAMWSGYQALVLDHWRKTVKLWSTSTDAQTKTPKSSHGNPIASTQSPIAGQAESKKGSETESIIAWHNSTISNLLRLVSSSSQERSKPGLSLPIVQLVDQTKEITAPARQALRQELRHRQRTMARVPQKGSLLVSGLIEFAGPKAIVVLDVRAWYHPRTNMWDTISWSIRRSAPLSNQTSGKTLRKTVDVISRENASKDQSAIKGDQGNQGTEQTAEATPPPKDKQLTEQRQVPDKPPDEQRQLSDKPPDEQRQVPNKPPEEQKQAGDSGQTDSKK